MIHNQAIAAIATPPGQGGIAIVRISGEGAYYIAQKVFAAQSGKRLDEAKGYTAHFGEFIWDGKRLDEGIALCFRAPHSYTGEDVVELSCHGGEAVSRNLLLACIKAGAQPAAPGEFTRRAVINGRLSLAQAEAVMELISASSRQGTALANSGLKGALNKLVLQQREKLVSLAGHLAAWVDYPEEDVENVTNDEFLSIVLEVKKQLDELIEGYDRGQIARRGVRTVIAGSPNVGKSTLFNLLSGFEHAIVTPVAGTTRDVIREQIQIAGVMLQLADTAGLHHTEDVVEKEGIRRSLDELDSAALVLAVFDGSEELGEQQLRLAERCQGHLALAIINKSDLDTRLDRKKLETYFTSIIQVSAKDSDSVDIIENAIQELLQVSNLDTDAASLINERQLAAAVKARDALQDAMLALNSGFSFDAAGVCLDDALYALAELTGDNVPDTVMDEVFSKFCVGK